MTNSELVALRQRLGMTQTQLAEALGMSISRIADYEAGITRGRNTPAAIPRTVELALAELERNEHDSQRG